APYFAHAVLYVELRLIVARPGQREPGEQPGMLHAGELILVEEIVVAVLMAEEQPVAAGRPGRHALVQEGTKRRNAGAGTDHDDRGGRVGGETEAIGLLHVDLDPVAGRGAFRQIGGGDAEPATVADFVAHGVDGERDPAGVALERWPGPV